MNKGALIEEILKSENSGLESKVGAEKALCSVLCAIGEGVKKDGNVQLIGFGTFKISSRAARTGRNPKTGVPIKIKASKTVTFKASAALKETAQKSKK
jgi:DNA-binding protein HU-beta